MKRERERYKEDIERVRSELILLAKSNNYHFLNPEVIQKSTELDYLLNLFERTKP